MVVRCISEEEAKQLRLVPTPAAAKPAPSVGSTKPASDTTASAATTTTASTTTTATTTNAVEAPSEPASPGDSEDANPDAALEVTVGPVTAEEGTLGVGKLGQPKDKYAACVQKNGGLSGKTGEVSVRFLVRGKGIAEGVSVSKRTNLSKEAAQCVADVVDRRRVGTPESPMVGATVVVKFAKLDKLTK
jgi:hypothetical protein